MPSLSTALNELSTLPFMIDECYQLYNKIDVQELLTNAQYEIEVRTTADNNKQGSNIKYNAYNTIISSTNRTNKTFDGLNRAMLYYCFDKPVNKENKVEYLNKFGDIDLEYTDSFGIKHITKVIVDWSFADGAEEVDRCRHRRVWRHGWRHHDGGPL